MDDCGKRDVRSRLRRLNPLGRFSTLDKEERRYWAPTLITVGFAISILGLSIINLSGLGTWADWLDIVIGLGMVRFGVIFSRKSEAAGSLSEQSASGAIVENDGVHIHIEDNIQHEILADRLSPYYLGESFAIRVRLKNLLGEPCTKKFFYLVQMPDGMYLHRPLYPVTFEANEEKIISLGDPVFLAFLGIFRVVIATGAAAEALIAKGEAHPLTFQTLFVGYSRDREGHELQKQMVTLTGNLRFLTKVLVAVTIVLVILTGALIYLDIV